jgi:hypothetical protein
MPPSPEQIPVPALGSARQRDLRFFGKRAKTHVRDEEGNVEDKGLLRARTDNQSRVYRHVFHQRLAGELRRQNLQIIPARQLRPGHTHRSHWTVVPKVIESVSCELVNERNGGLLDCRHGFGHLIVGAAWRLDFLALL